ncbi:TPA: glycosyl hydrolase family 18 protein, partial [Klebsiella oxytoca]
ETAASDSARKTFAKGVVKLFKQFPMFSEVDIDWEYPNAEGAGNPYGPEDGENYALLIGELRKQLDSAGLSNVKISIASSAVVKTFDYSNVKALLQAGLYGINVMTYDFFGTPWAETLTHHTNLNALEEGGWAVNTIV